MRVLAVIPARGGSKGIPGKNIRLLGGRPLLAYAAAAAKESRAITRIVLSTEDPEIARVGRSLGLDVPFMRPNELASDTAATLPVLQHALEQVGGEAEFDAVCLLQPTDPFRTAAQIDSAIGLLSSSGADSVVTVHRVPDNYNPHWVYFREPTGELTLATGETAPIPRRQDLPPAYHRSGSVYVTRTRVLRGGSLYGARCVGLETPADQSVNLDTLADWELAEALLSRSS